MQTVAVLFAGCILFNIFFHSFNADLKSFGQFQGFIWLPKDGIQMKNQNFSQNL
jgi:hypothetical protein